MSMGCTMEAEQLPLPVDDWITLTELSRYLGIAKSTASRSRRRGELAQFEHGFRPCGHRRYSRLLVEQHLRRVIRRTADNVAQRREKRSVPVASGVPVTDLRKIDPHVLVTRSVPVGGVVDVSG